MSPPRLRTPSPFRNPSCDHGHANSPIHWMRAPQRPQDLLETLKGKTILALAIENAMWGDDRSQPVHLIDSGNGNQHLELRRDLRYEYVVPDLNGRRYLNYERAAALARLAGEDGSYLHDRARALKKALRAELWSPSDHWSFLRTDKG